MNQATEKLKVPATIIMVIAGLSILFQLFNLIMAFMGSTGASLAKQIADPQAKQFVQMLSGGQGATAIIFSIFGLGLSAFVVFGAYQMRQGQNYGLSLAAAILYSIPCFSACCIGMPFGIWALVLLLNDDIKAAFGEGGSTPMGTDTSAGNSSGDLT